MTLREYTRKRHNLEEDSPLLPSYMELTKFDPELPKEAVTETIEELEQRIGRASVMIPYIKANQRKEVKRGRNYHD